MRFCVDTQLFVEAIRSERGFEALSTFYENGLPFTWLNAVVVQELVAGASRRGDAEAEEDKLLAPFITAGRLVTPSFSAWKVSGEALGRLHATRRIDRNTITKAFANDVLMAASCAEERITLVTRNTRDFSLIAEAIPFDFIEPWP